MKCPKCGNEMENGQLYCEKCGEEIRIVPDFEPELDIDIRKTMSNVVEDMRPEPFLKEKKRKARNFFLLLNRKQRAALSAVLILCLICLACALYIFFSFNNPESQYKKAMVYIGQKQYEKALPYMERAVELKPENVEYCIRLSQCYSACGDEKGTEEICLRIISLDGSNDEAYQRLIKLYEKQKGYGKINRLLLACEDSEIVEQYQAYMANPPQFSSGGGTYYETVSLKLGANTKGTIYYTMDGSDPSEESPAYASPIFLESGHYRIRAVFVNEYGISSSEAEESYFIDVTVPEAPQVDPESGDYGRPGLITVNAQEGCSVYYTLDGTTPTMDSVQYSGPFPMPVGYSRFRFVSYSEAGVAGEETDRAYYLNLHAALNMEAARNKLLIELRDGGIITDISGSVSKKSGRNVYTYKYALTIDGADYYLFREYYEDGTGGSNSTGSDYVVNVMSGQCYKAVRASEAAKGTADVPANDADKYVFKLEEIGAGGEAGPAGPAEDGLA